MSYLRKRYMRRNPRMGASTLGDVDLATLASTVGVAVDLARDPYLPETLCRISQLKVINAGGKPGACAKAAPNLKGGVGLGRMVPALRAYVYAEQHRWAYVVAGVAIIGIPMLIGYMVGRAR